MSNRDKLQKKFDELCKVISEEKFYDGYPKSGIPKDMRNISETINELKLVEYALNIMKKLES